MLRHLRIYLSCAYRPPLLLGAAPFETSCRYLRDEAAMPAQGSSDVQRVDLVGNAENDILSNEMLTDRQWTVDYRISPATLPQWVCIALSCHEDPSSRIARLHDNVTILCSGTQPPQPISLVITPVSVVPKLSDCHHMMAEVPQPEEDQVVTYGNRLFCRFSLLHKINCIPVDEAQERRYNKLNQVLRVLFDGPVISPAPFPVKDRKSRAIEEPLILDCGHGKGAWIDSLLADYEDGDLQSEYETEFRPEVVGIDVFLGDMDSDEEDEDDNESGVQEYTPKRWNLNAPFRQDRSESRLRPESFDLINCRLLAEGISAGRWQPLLEELRKLLKPGRWMQMVEIEYLVHSRNESLPMTSWLRKWWSHYTVAMVRMGKNPRVGAHLGRLMEVAGCEHISAGSRNVPLGQWQTGQAHWGRDNREIFHHTLESLSLWPFTARLGSADPILTAAEYRQLIAGARRELSSDGYQLYYKVYVPIDQRLPMAHILSSLTSAQILRGWTPSRQWPSRVDRPRQPAGGIVECHFHGSRNGTRSGGCVGQD
nr:secondary metabolism regulator lae1 [Quercus suber]